MADLWLCVVDQRQLGPVPFSHLQQLAAEGRLKASDRVRPVHDPEWSPAGEIPGLIPAAGVTTDVQLPPSSLVPIGKTVPPSGSAPSQHGASPSHDGGQAGASPSQRRGSPAPPPPPPPADYGSADAFLSPAPPLIADEPRPRWQRHTRSGENTTLLLAVGGSTLAGVIVLALVLVLSGVINLAPNREAVASTDGQNAAPVVPEPQDTADLEAAAAKVLPEPGAQADGNPTKRSPRKPTSDADLLKSIPRWNDVSRLKSLKVGPATVAITGLWLSMSEKGTPYVAASDEEESPAAKYLMITLTIENGAGAAPMKYQGWRNDAVLFDDAGKSLRPLGKAYVPIRIEAGQSHEETLIFRLDDIEFEKLRLLLPHDTIGIKDNKYFALELPRHALGRGVEGHPNNEPSDDPAAAAVDASLERKVRGKE